MTDRPCPLQGTTLLVQNEPFELVVTLRNPFIFDLELSSLALRWAIVMCPIRLILIVLLVHPVLTSRASLSP